jgi:hypothetical protein
MEPPDPDPHDDGSLSGRHWKIVGGRRCVTRRANDWSVAAVAVDA